MYIKDKVVPRTGKIIIGKVIHLIQKNCFHGKSFIISVRENWNTENQKEKFLKFLFRRKGKVSTIESRRHVELHKHK